MEIRFTDSSVEQYNNTPLKAGAQGTIYVSLDNKSVVKLYHPNTAKDRENRDRIEKLISRFNPTKQDPYWAQFFTWPEKCVASPGAGYRMRFVPGLKTLNYYIFPKTYKRLPPEEKGWFIGRIASAIKLVTAADRMARMGLCYPDFSDKNVMVDPFAGHMILIDCDSLTVPKLLPATIQGTSFYRAPEIVSGKVTIPSVESDRHALAVILYYWLIGCHPLEGDRPPLDPDPDRDDLLRLGEKALYIEDPSDSTNRNKGQSITSATLGPELQQLFRLAFVEGLHQPALRPLPYQWQKAFQRTYDRIVPCASQYCDWRFFVVNPNQRLVCPRCSEPLKNPPTLPIVYLHEHLRTGGPDAYSSKKSDAHYVVGWPGRYLHSWHVRPDATPFHVDPRHVPDLAPCAVFEYDRRSRQWVLKNLALPNMLYRTASDPAGQWRRWPINTSVALAADMQIQLGDAPHFFRASIDLHKVV